MGYEIGGLHGRDTPARVKSAGYPATALQHSCATLTETLAMAKGQAMNLGRLVQSLAGEM